jgi:hypothetical protein
MAVLVSGFVVSGVVACQQQYSQGVNPDATLDQASPPCVTSKDCSNGESSTYPMLVGCVAKGECRAIATGDSSDESGDSAACTTATTACGCNGKTVDIPACWNGLGLAPEPVQPTGRLMCEGGS